MPSRTKLITLIFGITAFFMLALSFIASGIADEPLYARIAVFLFAGLILSLLLSAIISSFVKDLEGRVREREKEMPATSPAPPEAKKVFEGRAVQLLAILQKDGRLVDFLKEDIAGYDDGQVGRAVRDIHKGCREAIDEHIHIEPVMKENEGAEVTVNQGFDPSAIRLTGNVIGKPPFRGVIRHSGWRATATSLPPIPKSQDAGIIEPAEVEIP